ncbi:MAG: glycosyltransferase family 4 protein [Gammaproteobacteria bacterium]
MTRPIRIAYLLSHPIQYQSAMLRVIAAQPDIELTVFFGLDTVSRGNFDEGFGQLVKWDVPLLDGYDHEFLPTLIGASRPGNILPLNRGLRARLREGRFDLLWIHGWGRIADLLAIRDARALGLPILMRTENNFRGTARPRAGCIQGLKERIKHWVMRRCDAFGYMGQAGYDYFRAYRVDARRLFNMPYMVDNEWLRAACAQADVAALRQRHDLGGERPVLLYVGKLIRRKGVMDLIEAYASLEPDGRPYLLIVGSGEMEVEARSRVETLALSRVRFAGFRNQGELPAYFAASDLFVIPSRDEQWGVVVNEAMNGACAVLASDECGSAPELVIEGETGFNYPAGDGDALALALRRALADPDRLRRMGEQARDHVATYDANRILQGLRGAIGFLERSGCLGKAGP